MTTMCTNTRNFYTLDGIPLHDPQGRWTLAEGAQIRSVPARRNDEHVIPGLDGVVSNLSPTFEPGALSFGIHILKGNTHDEAMRILDFWNGVIAQRHRLLPLDHTYDGSTKRAEIQIVASSETSNTFMRAITINIVATIPGAFWRDVSPSVSRFDVNATNRLEGVSGGTGPIDDAIIKVYGPFTSVKFYTPINPSEYVTFNTAAYSTQEIILSTGNWSGRIRNITSGFAMGNEPRPSFTSTKGFGTMFSIDPVFSHVSLSKEYMLKVEAVGATSATYGEILARRSYL